MAAYSTVQRVANTFSTDLTFKHDKSAQKLYVNYSAGIASGITIEYTPKLFDISDIKSGYWLDMLMKLTLAFTKVIIGRVRTRYVQSGALYTGDGDKILEEGQTELADLREKLRKANDMSLPID